VRLQITRTYGGEIRHLKAYSAVLRIGEAVEPHNEVELLPGDYLDELKLASWADSGEGLIGRKTYVDSALRARWILWNALPPRRRKPPVLATLDHKV